MIETHARSRERVERVLLGLSWSLCDLEHGTGLCFSPSEAPRTLAWPGNLRGRSADSLTPWLRSFEPAEAALAPLVLEVLENERAAAARAGCAGFASDVAPGLIVRADPDQLFRVLSNLVRNAAQAIEAGGRPGSVTVTASAVGDRTEIRVRDSGPGLPQKARDNLFQPFRGSGRQGGSGLGLVIAADLVRGHGGTLVLEETGPRGSTFRISLPAPGAQRRAG